MTFGALTPLRASGSTIDDKKAEAAHLEAEIQANGDRVDALGEQYNGAVLAYQNAQAAVAEAKRRLAVAQKQAGKLRGLVSAEAAVLYTGRRGPDFAAPEHEHHVGRRAQRAHAVRRGATGNDEQLIAELEKSQQDLKIEQKALDKQVASARRRSATSSRRRAQQVEQANAQSSNSCSRK